MKTKAYPEQPPILDLVKQRGFVIFNDGNYDLNIIALRRLDNRQHNRFDDTLHIVYKQGDSWLHEYCECTTDAGTYWLTKEDYRKDGVAVLIHDQQAREHTKSGNIEDTKHLNRCKTSVFGEITILIQWPTTTAAKCTKGCTNATFTEQAQDPTAAHTSINGLQGALWSARMTTF